MASLERFVYLMRAGEDHYKVGIAQDVNSRIKEIQTGNPKKIELVVAVWLANAQTAENRIHKWLNRFKSNGGREWFELTSGQALFLVTKMTSLTMPDDVSRYMVVRNLMARQDKIEERLAKLERPEIADPPSPIKAKPPTPVDEQDDLFTEASHVVMREGRASASMLQRRLRVGYARAARLLDELEKEKIIGPADGSRPREVIRESPLVG